MHECIAFRDHDTRVLPTLLSAHDHMKELFTILAWLHETLVTSLYLFEDRHRQEVTVAEQARAVLTSLHDRLDVEFLHSSPRQR